MKRIILSAVLLTLTIITRATTANSPQIDNTQMNITRIDPTDWFAGMKNPKLQLMVYGHGINKTQQVTTTYPGVVVDSIVHPQSENYLFIYLNLEGAQPGDITLAFDGTPVKYTLKKRDMKGEERKGFTNADVLYMLMPDRFAQGKNHNPQITTLRPYTEDRKQPSLRHGGDLEGIREHLDYFTDLGVTALWFTPVLENSSPDAPNHTSTYHGYATTDYYRIDPRFGTNDEYKKLCQQAHQRGLKIVMDMIFNHCGFDHPWVSDMPMDDWFNQPQWLDKDNPTPKPNDEYLQTSYKLTPVIDPYASKIDKRETLEGWFVPTMPDLNQHNTHLMRYLIQNSIWWIETAGIDGIRMDTYPYAFPDAMAEWMAELNNEYPHFNTVGETWVTEPAYTAAWQKGSPLTAQDTHLKTVMDFALFDKINAAKNEDTDTWWTGLNRIYNTLCYDYLYPHPESVMAFIENHDTDRFLGNGRDTLALKQALALLLTIKRIPQLYYGTEVLMNGTKEITDGNVRRDFPGGFPGDTHTCFTREGRTKAQNSMYAYTRRLLTWRRANEVIAHGTQTQFIPYNGIYVIARQYNGNTVLTILNGRTSSSTLSMKRYAEVIGTATKAKDVITQRWVDLTKDRTLKPRENLILEF